MFGTTMKSAVARPCVRFTVIATLLGAGTLARAECGGTLEQAVCANVQLASVYIDSANHAYATVQSPTTALPCAAPSGLLKLAQTTPNFKAVYASLLASHLANRSVTMRLAPDASECRISYVMVH